MLDVVAQAGVEGAAHGEAVLRVVPLAGKLPAGKKRKGGGVTSRREGDSSVVGHARDWKHFLGASFFFNRA